MQISDIAVPAPKADLRSQLLARITAQPKKVRTPADFVDLANRDAVDKLLQRLAGACDLRRIDRGLYDRPATNRLTGRSTAPDYRAVVRAVARRDKARFVVDGRTAANDLGLTNAVPAKIEVLTDSRPKPIKLENQEIRFKVAAPSRLYWAGRPAMRVVQALHGLHDVLDNEEERRRIASVLDRLLADPKRGPPIRDDLREGFSALPIWMQEYLRPLVFADTARS